jgi:hypothetical protein
MKNFRKMFSILVLAFIGGVFLVQHQNCSVPPENQFNDVADEDSVSIVDDLIQNKLSFVEKAKTVSVFDSLQIDGLCDRKSAEMIEWTLSTMQEIALDQGQAQCSLGGFRIKLSQLTDFNCDENYKVTAHSDAGKVDSMDLFISCE